MKGVAGLGRRAGRLAAGTAIALSVAAGLAVLGTWNLEASVRSRLEAALAASLEPGGQVQVHLEARPPLKLLAGRVDRLRVSARRLRLGDLVADRLELVGEGLQLEQPGSGPSGGLPVRSARQLEVRMSLSEQTLNAYLRGRYELARLVQVRLTPSGPRLEMKAEAGKTRVAVSLEGRLQVEPGNVIALVPDRLAIRQGGVEALALSVTGLGQPMELVVEALPVPVTIEQVASGDGELHVLAQYRGG